MKESIDHKSAWKKKKTLPERSTLLGITIKVFFCSRLVCVSWLKGPLSGKESEEWTHSFSHLGSCPNLVCSREIGVGRYPRGQPSVRVKAGCGPVGSVSSQGEHVSMLSAWLGVSSNLFAEFYRPRRVSPPSQGRTASQGYHYECQTPKNTLSTCLLNTIVS